MKTKPILSLLVVVLFFTCCGAPFKRSAPAPVRGFLYRGEQPPGGLGAHGYLVFNGKPSAATQSRYRHTCESFLKNFPPIEDYDGKDPASLMITYWLVDQRSSNVSDCGALVEHYDYATANEIASEVKKLSATGPVLVAWSKPYGRDAGTSDALVLDLSDFSDDDLDRAMGIWKDRIVRDPSVWNKGFNSTKAKEAFRNLLQRYGDQILTIIKPTTK